ncbi:MAG: ABC transporter permease [Sandarakinorhabdus sp.]|nr:ABC transporter permease [Sandarakinorhabdus sp.]
MKIRFATAVAVIGGWTLVALLAPWLAPHDPLANYVPLQPPRTPGFALGTDLLGRDILSRLIWGARPVVMLSLAATLLAYAIGVGAGLVAGYRGGWVDAVLSFVSNVILSFPVLVLYLVIIVALGPSDLNVIVAITFGSAPAVFRITRDLASSLAGRDYVAAAVTQGETLWRILAIEIFANAAPPLVTDFCLRLGYSVMMVGALGFLGLGLPPPAPDWGGMVTDGRALAFAFPYLVLFPCFAIASLVLALSVVADQLSVAQR